MVPKIIHHITGKPQTPLIEKCLQSWKALQEKHFRIIIWNDELIANFLLENFGFAYEAFINARNHAEAADIARYLIIYKFGGCYVDWDVELLDINKFLLLLSRHTSGFMLKDPTNGTLASEFFCATAGDEYLLLLTMDIAYLYKTERRNTQETPQYSGPYRMRESLLLHPKTNMNTIPVKEVFAYDYSEITDRPKGAVIQPLIHYWVHSWIKHN